MSNRKKSTENPNQFLYSFLYLRYIVTVQYFHSYDISINFRMHLLFFFQLFRIHHFSVSPDTFKIIEQSVLFVEKMNYDVTVVQQDPVRTGVAFHLSAAPAIVYLSSKYSTSIAKASQ